MNAKLQWAIENAVKAGEIAMRYFRSDIEVMRKKDASPVTIADREIETFLRSQIERDFPDAGILGEEFDEKPGGSERWVIDPIDGTKSFVYGVPLFGTLLGLERDGEPILGVAHFPALRETYWGSDEGAFLNSARIRVNDIPLSESLLLTGSIKALEASGRLDAFLGLAKQAYATRSWSDAYGHCLVARGDAGAILDPVVSLWDTCAVAPIVRAAGGRFTDFNGTDTHAAGEAISMSPAVVADILKATKNL